MLTLFNNTQQQHNDMPQNVNIVDQQYIAINIVNVWTRRTKSNQQAFALVVMDFILSSNLSYTLSLCIPLHLAQAFSAVQSAHSIKSSGIAFFIMQSHCAMKWKSELIGTAHVNLNSSWE